MSVTPDDGRTHWHGCEQERGHHACALAELARLRCELKRVSMERDTLRQAIEFYRAKNN